MEGSCETSAEELSAANELAHIAEDGDAELSPVFFRSHIVQHLHKDGHVTVGARGDENESDRGVGRELMRLCSTAKVFFLRVD